MSKRRIGLGILLAAALVVVFCLTTLGIDKASAVKPATATIQSGAEQAAEPDYDKQAAYQAAKAAWLADMEAEKSTAAEHVPAASTEQRLVGDDCTQPLVLTLGSGDLPCTLTNQFTCGRGNNYDNTCLGNFDGGEDIIYQLNLTEDLHLNITLDPKGTEFTGILLDATCPADPSDCLAQSRSSVAQTHGLVNVCQTAGTYYIMVDTWPSPVCITDFDLTFESIEATPGDDCNDPVVVKIPEDMNGGPNFNAYIDEGQTTCGRGNDYENTCLDEWDSGDDIIYQLDVSQAIDVDIFLDPGPTNWSGIVIDDNCPPDESDCIQYSVIGSGAHGLYDVSLDPGVYYIMVDTYAYPDCIPSFTLMILPVGGGPINDDWDNCLQIGDVVDLPFSTEQATPDGPGGCLTSPNIWYCYTATCTGTAVISLCGSSYDTKLAVYDGTNPFYDPLMGCNDDSEACGEFSAQSQLEVPVIKGNIYLVGVGGWGDHTGVGILNTNCYTPPENDNCEDVTPVTLTDGVPVTFTGDNTWATHQCDFFDGPHVWHAFTLDTTMIVTLDYCTTDPAFTSAWVNPAIGCPCSDTSEAGVYNFDDCGDGNITITWDFLEPDTYYYPVLHDEGAEGPYTLHVVGEAIAAYCKASGACDFGYISRVAVGDIDTTSICDDGYSDYTSLSTTMETGESYPITVELGNGITPNIGAVWIDWNQDLTFDMSEEVDLDVFSGEGPYTGNVIPPGNAVSGTTMMRVRVNYNTYPPPCGYTDHGEVEDYTINVNVTYICGDADGNQLVNIADVVYLINYVFGGGPPPDPLLAGDVDCNALVNIADVVYLINYIFGGGPDPCDPDGDGIPDC